ncbi:MAG: hypothetical protein ABMB14_01015 [Myxococcota bacterium]
MHALLVLASLTSESRAAEVQFEGFYRARFRAFDTLSLSRDNALGEGLAAYAQHRLWLEPKFLISDKVGMYVQIRALDGVPWGFQPGAYDAFVTPQPNLFEYDLDAPTSSTDETATLLDITLWRAWGEVYTPIGHFSFGRMALHWGSGIWLNDGLSVEPMFADYGDTTDRVMWEQLIQDQFYLRATIDVPTERYLGENDDTTAFGLATAYKTEDLTAGILLQLDHTGARQNLGSLNVFTADLAGDAVLGKLNASAEVVGQFGGGDLDGGINAANITALGGVLEAGLDLDPWKVAVQGGLATGDGVPNDLNLRTFTFDRDFSVGMFLFEQPMPILATTAAAANDTNGARDYSAALSGTAVSNALFLKPHVSRELVDGLTVDLAWLTARAAKLPPTALGEQLRGYGHEFQLGVGYTGIEHFLFDARLGAFLPGSVYSVAEIGQVTEYRDAAFGFQLGGRVDF